MCCTLWAMWEATEITMIERGSEGFPKFRYEREWRVFAVGEEKVALLPNGSHVRICSVHASAEGDPGEWLMARRHGDGLLFTPFDWSMPRRGSKWQTDGSLLVTGKGLETLLHCMPLLANVSLAKDTENIK